LFRKNLHSKDNREYPAKTDPSLGIFYEPQWILDPFIPKVDNDKELRDFSSKISNPILNWLLSGNIAEELFDYLGNK